MAARSFHALFAMTLFLMTTGEGVTRGQDGRLRVGVMTDLSGPLSDFGGMGSVVAAQMAAEDFGGKVSGAPIEIVSADHQNRPDIAASIARRWIENEGVDIIVDVPGAAAALAVQNIVVAQNKVAIFSSAASSELTSRYCSPNTIQWTFDTWALANAAGRAMMRANEGSWFILSVDTASGKTITDEIKANVSAVGGQIAGNVFAPAGTSDYSSFLLTAQTSKARVVAIGTAGNDALTIVKQAAEWGLPKGGQRLAGMALVITDIHALGLPAAKGLITSESFYWDLNQQTRAWSERFAQRLHSKLPNMVQAGVYSAVTHYLKAVEATQTEDGRRIVQQMKATPTDDVALGHGSVRRDGRKLHPMYVFEVKDVSETKYPWDYYKLTDTIPPEQAFRPLEAGSCDLSKQ
jgi:branched-chain amino acid transport system substrate-binding protein